MLNLQVIRLISFFFIFILYVSFIGELLLEWLTLNFDSKNSTTQAFLQQLKSCLHSNSNTNSNEHDLRKVILLLILTFK
jgi:hypothetical protein